VEKIGFSSSFPFFERRGKTSRYDLQFNQRQSAEESDGRILKCGTGTAGESS
jgi:hypothetical protein